MPINDTIASEQWYRFRWCVERGHFQFIEKADKCDKFFAGLQWSPADLASLQLQRRPALTINKIISTVATIQGEQIYNRNEVTFRPAYGAKPETAEALTKVWMQIAQNNQLPWVRSDVFADGIIRSRGFYDVRLDFSDSMRGEVRITQQNSKNVIIDPDAEEYDPDSWNDVFISKWLTWQDIATLYNEDDAKWLKEKETSLFPYAYDSIERYRDRFAGQALIGSYYGVLDSAHVRRNYRVLERQYRQLSKQKHFVDVVTGDMRPIPDGWDREKIAHIMQTAQGQLAVIDKKVKRVRWTVTADNVVLHDDWSPYKHFTVVPFFPQFRYGQTLGVVEHLLGPQELLNKTTSQELHVINTTANSGYKVKAGALKNMSIEELEQTGASTGIVLELDDVANVEKIQPNQIPTGLDRLSFKAEEYIKSVSNVSDSMQGFDREDVAAKATIAKTQRSSVNMAKVLDNLERSDWLLARTVLDIVQAYYSEERIINITHDDILKEPETLVVNQLDEATGEIVNDLTEGEYDIVITSQPYRASLEDSQFEQAVRMREIGVQLPDDVLIENSRLLRRTEIVKKMTAAAESPEAQARQQLELRGQEATVAKLEADVAKTHADAQLQSSKAQREMAEAQGGAEGAELAKLRMEEQAAMRKLELEAFKTEEELKLKREAMQMEFALKREQLQQEAAIKQQQAAQDAAIKQQQAEQDAKLREEEAARAAEEDRRKQYESAISTTEKE